MQENCTASRSRQEQVRGHYGNRTTLRLEWLIHAQEEAMDLAVYLQKLIEMEQKTIHEKMQERADRINDTRRAHRINKLNDEVKE